MKKIRLFSILFIMIAGLSFGTKAQLNLLSGIEGGTYQALSKDIKSASTQEIIIITSKGSVDNFEQLIDNSNDIFVAFIQYDVLIHNETLKEGLRKKLRVLLHLFLDEEVHIITKSDSKIINLSDLKGKKVAVGSKGQGTFVSAATIKKASRIDWIDVPMSINDAQKALDAGEIDAYFYVGGAPVNSLLELGKSAKLRLVNIDFDGLENIYSKKVIAKGTYPWQKKEVTTFVVPTVLVCNVKDMTIDTRRKLNTLISDTKAGLGTFQKKGHAKWKEVYVKSHAINWPYYYLKPIVE